jgi:hypothetical protein
MQRKFYLATALAAALSFPAAAYGQVVGGQTMLNAHKHTSRQALRPAIAVVGYRWRAVATKRSGYFAWPNWDG